MDTEKTGTFSLKDMKIANIPAIPFLILFAIVMLGAYTDNLGDDMFSAIAFMFVLGGLLYEIGERIPIFNTWLGGGSMLAMMMPSFLIFKGLIPQQAIDNAVLFYDEFGFQVMYICFLMGGSILLIDKATLIKSVVRYIPTILAGVAVAAIFGILAGAALGHDIPELLSYYVLPIMGGGNGAGAIPLSQIFNEITGGDKDAFYAKSIAILTFANCLCVIVGALLNGLGKAFPKLTGDGTNLLRDTSKEVVAEKETKLPNVGIIEVGTSFCWLGAMYVLACVLKDFGPKLGGAKIHQYAWLVVILIVCNVTDIIPLAIRAGMKKANQFFTKAWAGMIFCAVGMSMMDFSEFLSVLNMDTLIISLAVVLGAVVGTAVVGFFLGFHPIDAAITAGLCMANRGGSGDLAVLSAANRMELMTYAAISSRIGGALILVIASVLFGLIY